MLKMPNAKKADVCIRYKPYNGDEWEKTVSVTLPSEAIQSDFVREALNIINLKWHKNPFGREVPLFFTAPRKGISTLYVKAGKSGNRRIVVGSAVLPKFIKKENV